MESAIRIRSCEERDERAVVGLLSAFYENIKCAEDWKYLYLDNPEGPSVISLAEEVSEGRLAGHYSVIRLKWVIFGERYPGGKGEGEIFDLSYLKGLLKSGKKIGSAVSTDLVRHTVESSLKEGMKIVCTNPNDLALKSHLDAGFELLEQDLSIFVLVLGRRYLAHLLSKERRTRKAPGIISAFLTGVLKTLFLLSTFYYRDRRITFEPLERFDSGVDAFSKSFNGLCKYIDIEREHKHLNWRFGGRDFKKFLIKFRGQAIGYAVLHVFMNPAGFREACLVDYLLMPGRWSGFRSVIVWAAGEARKRGCDLLRLNYMHDCKDALGVLKCLKNSFLLRRKDKRNIVVFLSPQLAPLRKRILDVRNWYFTDLYFEGY